jgi:DNA polymerase (family 10)
MTNKQIALAFDELANLLELHEENEFKVRSYRNAYLTLRKLDRPLSELPDAELKALKGIGPAISSKIREVLDSGHISALEEARAKTPPGVVEMLDINGFGPKKVRQVWLEMGIETVGELLYACNENRLVEYKGFGLKTQQDLQQRLEYYLRSRGQLHCDAAEAISLAAGARLTAALPGALVAPVGEVRRRCPVVRRVELLLGWNSGAEAAFDDTELVLQSSAEGTLVARTANGTEVTIYQCRGEEFGSKMFQYTGNTEFIEAFVKANNGVNFKGLRHEDEVFDKASLPYVVPELRESGEAIGLARGGNLPVLVEQNDLRGVLHVHTTWSDGLHTLRQMAERANDLGYQYIGITDHSQSAFYANGLKEDRLRAQWDEIDALNAEFGPAFRILKGIESDILSDGSLDYPDAVLEGFDFVIASVHSNLKMTRERATERVVRAIEHPRTTILGHPTGRLLLSREGYPLDWDAVFEACQKHDVAIELNAHPYRLDIDWTLIPKALQHGIKISINPDAHSLDGLEHVRYGLQVARKGGLTAAACFNAGDFGGN